VEPRNKAYTDAAKDKSAESGGLRWIRQLSESVETSIGYLILTYVVTIWRHEFIEKHRPFAAHVKSLLDQ
jgi:hypothetical protein